MVNWNVYCMFTFSAFQLLSFHHVGLSKDADLTYTKLELLEVAYQDSFFVYVWIAGSGKK